MISRSHIIQLDQIWAKGAYNANPNVDATPPNSAKIDKGFNFGEKPSHATFNWIMYKVMANAVQVQQWGILPWDASVDYNKGAITTYAANATSMPQVFQSINGAPHQNRNINHEPKGANLGKWWKLGIEDTGGVVKKMGNQDPSDKSGGNITGDIVIKSGGRLIIDA